MFNFTPILGRVDNNFGWVEVEPNVVDGFERRHHKGSRIFAQHRFDFCLLDDFALHFLWQWDRRGLCSRIASIGAQSVVIPRVVQEPTKLFGL